MYEYSTKGPDRFNADLAKFAWQVKKRVDGLEAGQARVDHLMADYARVEHYLAPYVKAQQAERLRQGQYDRATRYTEARQDLYQTWQERMTTSSGAKRHLMKGLVADMIRGALTMRDQARTAAARDLANAEVARLTRLEQTL
jgi:hypothetical protein